MKQLKRETQRHRDAFELWYETKNASEVARRFNVTLSSVMNWKKSFNWEERAIIRDREIINARNEKIAEAQSSILAVSERKAKYLKMVEAVLATAFERQEDGTVKVKIKCKKPADLRQLIEVALKLMGEPERQEIQHRGIEDITFKFEVEEKDANQDTA